MRDGKGGWTDEWGVIVSVTEKVEQDTLPLEDRIPSVLRNPGGPGEVPIQILEIETLSEAPESNCNISMCGVTLVDDGEIIETINTQDWRKQVRHKYQPLFWRQPNGHMVVSWRLRDEEGEATNVWSITVFVTKRVHPSSVPPEDRLPECLEGIPIQVLEMEEVPLV